jgi:hypothetical protein
VGDQARLIRNVKGGGGAGEHEGTRDTGEDSAALAEKGISIVVKGHDTAPDSPRGTQISAPERHFGQYTLR